MYLYYGYSLLIIQSSEQIFCKFDTMESHSFSLILCLSSSAVLAGLSIASMSNSLIISVLKDAMDQSALPATTFMETNLYPIGHNCQLDTNSSETLITIHNFSQEQNK